MKGIRIGYAMCGSFCTIADSLEQLKVLSEMGADIVPIMSDIVYNSDTRFTKHQELQSHRSSRAFGVREAVERHLVATKNQSHD